MKEVTESNKMLAGAFECDRQSGTAMNIVEESSSAAAARLARAALRYLAERQLPPTPDEYRRAWHSVGGPAAPADARCDGQANQPVAMAPLISELVGLLETPHRNWTRARKKEALNRVLANNQSNAPRLVERLTALFALWKSDLADRPAEPVPLQQRPAETRPKQCDDELPHSDHLRSLLAEMTRLLVAVCDTVPTLVEEEAWVRRQFDTLRATLDPQVGHPDRRDLVQARNVLRRTAEEHQRLLKLRRDSLQMMKSMIAQCIEWLRVLTESSDRYGGKLGAYIEQIQHSPDLATLAGTVHELIEETRAIYSEFDVSKRDFAAAGARARQLEEEVNRLAQELNSASAQVMTDHLTSLLNRRGLEQSFDDMVADCRGAGRELSLALLDVDDFKRVNDVLGHQAGDEALRRLAALLKTRVRPQDLSARYGGEEFVVLLPDLDADAAAAVIRRVQRALTTEVFLHGRERVFVTFSAGVAQLAADETLAHAVGRADDAMYQAKRSGKNRVYVAAPA